jgi:hypothetical protein
LRDWATEPPKRAPQRRDLNIKAHAAWLADPERMQALFRAQADEAEGDLRRIGEHWSKIQSINGATGTPKISERLFGTYANVRLALANTRELVDWCRWMEREFAKLANSRRSPGSGRKAARPQLPPASARKPRAARVLSR